MLTSASITAPSPQLGQANMEQMQQYQSRVSVMMPGAPQAVPVQNMNFAQSPISTSSRIAFATRGVANNAQFVTTVQQSANPPPGASYVAPPKYITSTVPVHTTRSVAPIPLRPSYVAAPPEAFMIQQGMAPVAVAAPAPVMTYAHSTTPTIGTMPQPQVLTMGTAHPVVQMVAPSVVMNQPTVESKSSVTAPPAVPVAEEEKPKVDYVPREIVTALETRLAQLEIEQACRTHSAIIFIKPQAMTKQVQELVQATLRNCGIFVRSEGQISAERIDDQRLIDTHYGAIADKALNLTPAELTVQPEAQAQFEVVFGISWAAALEAGILFNSTAGAEKLDITPHELGARWSQLGGDEVKLGGGFYVGKIEDIFIVNGFYMNMRSKFVIPETCIYYFDVEWEVRSMSWAEFRGRVIGVTDPTKAEVDSLRNYIYQNWEALDLAACPSKSDNAVHASASPFEGMAERMNWLSEDSSRDVFGRGLLASGIPSSTIDAWCQNPTVTLDGQDQDVFDALEDTNAGDCLHTCITIHAQSIVAETDA